MFELYTQLIQYLFTLNLEAKNKRSSCKNGVVNKRLVRQLWLVSNVPIICLSCTQGHDPWPISRLLLPHVLYMERVDGAVRGKVGYKGWEVTTQELICLSLRGRQEIGLSCPDGRWPLWRQSRVKLLPGPFENISVLLEWLAIWASVPSSNPPLCQAWGVGGMSGKHGSFHRLP